MIANRFRRIPSGSEVTLKCRNATELVDKVINAPGVGLATLGTNFYLSNGFSAEGGIKNVVFSLKDHYFSSEFTQFNNSTGEVFAYENNSLPPSYGSTGDA